MSSFQEDIIEYRKQLQKGAIQRAYQGLMEYTMGLRSNFESKYSDYSVSESIYSGYMGMMYFSFFLESLKLRRIEVGIASFIPPLDLKYGCSDTTRVFKQSIGVCLEKAVLEGEK